MSRVTIGGHSFGAATAIATTAFAPAAFRSVLVLDGWMFPLEWDLYPKARQPMLFINAEKFQWVDNVQRMMRFDGNIAERTIITLR
jgi:platelet-activating factor acetylhydrolase